MPRELSNDEKQIQRFHSQVDARQQKAAFKARRKLQAEWNRNDGKPNKAVVQTGSGGFTFDIDS